MVTDTKDERTSPSGSAYRVVMASILFFFVVHLVALPALALLVQPGFDASRPSGARAQWIADHSLLWRLGWLPWQLSALSDVILTAALWRWTRLLGNQAANRWMWVAAAANLLAVVPEQIYEAILVTSHVGLARDATTDSSVLAAFADQQTDALVATSIWAATAYLVMTVAWHRALVLAAGEVRWFHGFAAKALFVTVGLLAVVAGLLAAQVWLDRNPKLLISVVGGLGFSALLLWSLAAADLAGRAQRSGATDGPSGQDRFHRAVWPTAGAFGAGSAGIANSGGLRDLLRPLPFAPLRSDIRDVVYLNWLVPTDRAQPLLPSPLACDDLDGLTAVSILTYQHGSLGPSALGPLRRLFVSPRQSNWRLYVEPITASGRRDAIYFFKVSLDSGLHVLVARLLADGLPAHRAQSITHLRNGTTITTSVSPGAGSGYGLEAVVEEASRAETDVPAAWLERFTDWQEAVAYLVHQNRALIVDNCERAVRESEISIPIALPEVRAAAVETLRLSGLPSELAPRADSEVWAFVVPQVAFNALGERTIASF